MATQSVATVQWWKAIFNFINQSEKVQADVC